METIVVSKELYDTLVGYHGDMVRWNNRALEAEAHVKIMKAALEDIAKRELGPIDPPKSGMTYDELRYQRLYNRYNGLCLIAADAVRRTTDKIDAGNERRMVPVAGPDDPGGAFHSEPGSSLKATCNCRAYNGGPCYNCLNGGHAICEGTSPCSSKKVSVGPKSWPWRKR